MNPILARISIGYLSAFRKGFPELLRQPVSYDDECAMPG